MARKNGTRSVIGTDGERIRIGAHNVAAVWAPIQKVEVSFIQTEFGFYRTRNNSAVFGMIRNLTENGVRVISAGSVYLPENVA